jgi:pimeloyl-ACP methyl ester carboxylesterase
MRGILLGLVLLLARPWASAATAEDWISVAARPGVEVKCLLTQERDARPTRVLLLFPGGGGKVRLESAPGGQVNFLVRARALLTGPDIASAVVDLPSDQPEAISDGFRTGPVHAADVAAVMDALKVRIPTAEAIYLVGTSRGTLSALNAGRRLADRTQGIVLTAAVWRDGLDAKEFQGLTVPVLLVHHRDDACKASPYYRARWTSEKFKLTLVTVEGGAHAVTDPCEPGSPHGFWGKEAETAEQILRWVRGEPVREKI